MVTEASDKEVEGLRPEIDDDTRAESSEGSSGHHWGTADGADSDDEFLDAVEPPLSTGLVLDNTGPPLSGVYVDAVEATVEQVTEALGTTLSDKGSQSSIPEEEEDQESVTAEAATESETGVIAAIQTAIDNQTEDNGVMCAFGINDKFVNGENPISEKAAVVEAIASPGVEEAAFKDPANTEVLVEEVVYPVDGDPVDGEGNQQLVVDANELVVDKRIEEMYGPVVSKDIIRGDIHVNAAVAIELQAVVEKLADDVADLLALDTFKSDLSAENGTATDQIDEGISVDATEDEFEQNAAAETRDEAVTLIDEDVLAILMDAVTSVVAENQTTEALSASQVPFTEENGTKHANADISSPSDVSDEIADTPAVGDVRSEASTTSKEVCPTVDRDTASGKSALIDEFAAVDEELSVEKETKQSTPKVKGATEEIVVSDEDTTPVVGLKDATSASADEQQFDVVEESATYIVLEISEQGADEADTVLPLAVNDAAVADSVAFETLSSDDSVEYSVTEAGVVRVVKEPESVIKEAENVQAVAEELTSTVVNESLGPIADEHGTGKYTSGEGSAPETTVDDIALDGKEFKPQPEEVPTDQPNEAVTESMAGTLGEVSVPEVTSTELASRNTRPSDNVSAGISAVDYAQAAVTSPTTALAHPLITNSANSPEIMSTQRWTYQIFGFTIEKRVVLYHIHKTDRRTGFREAPILKRYNDFRELELQLVGSTSPLAANLPRLPKPNVGTFIRGRKSKKTIEVREKAFQAMLKYIALYPELHGSAIFERFLEKNRDTHARWM
ncbi:hypothetical protein PHYBOEH_003809 [Phytophthora boehmeriae]|uniref:PX domain-containing protein n=1 Tax=Phytophthora boehmeriae TaxID=109152 RepID=A0A8T1X9B6_9STRA|nr:hypothetical protein PHYBOEH_003809 [Phytophthora boehmeriae]